jgi:hypothetical protein
MTDEHNPGHTMRDPVATWEDILDLIAEDDAETGTPTQEDRQWSQRLDAKIKSRVVELRRRLTPTDVAIQRGVTIPSEILALDREAVVAQLEIWRQSGDVQLWHRDLTGLSDNSLRIALTIAMKWNRR